MSRSDRRAWNARGAQIIGKIENSSIHTKDKKALNHHINYSMDREEAFYLMGHKQESDDDYSS